MLTAMVLRCILHSSLSYKRVHHLRTCSSAGQLTTPPQLQLAYIRAGTAVESTGSRERLAWLFLDFPGQFFRVRALSSMPASEKWWDENTTAVVTGGVCSLKAQHHDIKLSRLCDHGLVEVIQG